MRTMGVRTWREEASLWPWAKCGFHFLSQAVLLLEFWTCQIFILLCISCISSRNQSQGSVTPKLFSASWMVCYLSISEKSIPKSQSPLRAGDAHCKKQKSLRPFYCFFWLDPSSAGGAEPMDGLVVDILPITSIACPPHPNLLIKPAKVVTVHLVSGYSSHKLLSFLYQWGCTIPQLLSERKKILPTQSEY